MQKRLSGQLLLWSHWYTPRMAEWVTKRIWQILLTTPIHPFVLIQFAHFYIYALIRKQSPSLVILCFLSIGCARVSAKVSTNGVWAQSLPARSLWQWGHSIRQAGVTGGSGHTGLRGSRDTLSSKVSSLLQHMLIHYSRWNMFTGNRSVMTVHVSFFWCFYFCACSHLRSLEYDPRYYGLYFHDDTELPLGAQMWTYLDSQHTGV